MRPVMAAMSECITGYIVRFEQAIDGYWILSTRNGYGCLKLSTDIQFAASKRICCRDDSMADGIFTPTCIGCPETHASPMC